MMNSMTQVSARRVLAIVFVLCVVALGQSMSAQTSHDTAEEQLEYLNGGTWTYVIDACADGNIVYTANPFGVLIMDFTVPADPDTAAFVFLYEGCRSVALKDNYLFVAGAADSLIIYDVTDPYNPAAVPGMDFATDLNYIFIKDSLAFIAGTGRSLHIVNIADPLNPFIYSTHTFSDDVRDVAVSGDYLLAACEDAGLQIIDISDLAAPDSVSGLATPGFCRGVDIIGTYAYLADHSGGMVVVDFSTVATPGITATYDDQYVMSIEADYPYLYIGGGTYLHVTEHTTGYALDTLGSYDPSDGYPAEICVDGTVLSLTVANGVYLMVDVSDPALPTHVGGYQSRRYVKGIYLRDDLAYVTNYNNGLFIVDYSDPANLVQLGHYPNLGGASEVVVQDSLAIIACWGSGISILNIGDPANPTFVGSYTGMTDPTDICVRDTLVYATRTNLYEGFQIINIADPTNPVFITEYVTPGYPNAISVKDTVAYVADRDSGLQIVDVSNPNSPAPIANYPMSQRASEVFAVGDVVFVGMQYSPYAIYILDVTDPAAPDSIGAFTVFGAVNDIKVVGNYAFVSTSLWVNVIDITDLGNPVTLGYFRVEDVGNELAVDEDIIAVAAESGFLLLRSSTAPLAAGDEPERVLPITYAMRQNYPNPFNPETIIEYTLPRQEHVSIEICNILGQRVTTIVDEPRPAGTYEIAWDGRDSSGRALATGVYFYRITAGDFSETKKMVLLK